MFFQTLKMYKTIDKSIPLVFDQINLSSAKSAIHFIDLVFTLISSFSVVLKNE